jgi:ribosomal protein S18 acetylase RimI-like enzyme
VSEEAQAAHPSFGVLSLAVSAAARGTGAAAELMAAAETEAAGLGFRQMHLTVDPRSGRAVAFYEKQGWERVPAGVEWTGLMVKSLTGG